MAAPALYVVLGTCCAAHAGSHAGPRLRPASLVVATGASRWRDALARDAREQLGAGAADGEGDEAAMCVDFLARRMPERDRGLSPEFLARNCALAVGARRRHPWAASVPWPLFLEYVAPYASFDELRDEWRPLFAELLAPLVAGAPSAREAALRMNALLWAQWAPPIRFVPQQTRPGHPGQLSPLAVIRAGNASCTGLSVMLVDALRAVGVPARVVGTPVWNRAGCSHEPLSPLACGNHNWCEVWLRAEDGAPEEGGWHFFGAAEGGIDEAWFFPQPARLQRPGGSNVSIYAARFGPPGGAALGAEHPPPAKHHFPMVWAWADTSVGADDVTLRYFEGAGMPPAV